MQKTKNFFSWKQLSGCTVQCEVDLKRLFDTDKQRDHFESRWPEFLASDPYNRRVYRKTGNFLTYRSEQLIPKKKRGTGERKDRKPLLLVFGNPATYSVEGGMFFSFDEERGEHRFWTRILKPTGVLELPVCNEGLSAAECNRQRRETMFRLKYKSRFRIGLSVIVSMPSAASEKTWSGVAGVQRLLGAAAMRRLEQAETERVLIGAKRFLDNSSGSRIGVREDEEVGQGGAVIAFQKNAWNCLKSENDPDYDLKKARSGRLQGALKGMPGVPIYCVPPTRLAGVCSGVLEKVVRGIK